MYGGNDSFNTIVPMSGTDQVNYLASRGDLAITSGLNALTPVSGGGPSNYGLHPAMPELAGLFNSGKAAIVANVGSLLYPTTQSDYQNGTVPTPAQLFSHDDQTNQWMTSRSDDANANGWGGRIADLLYSSNAGQVPMSITLSGQNRFQRGGVVNQFTVDPWGASCAASGAPDCGPFSVTTMSYLGNGPESWLLPWQDPNVVADDVAAYNALIQTGTQTHVLERAFADSATRTIANATLINTWRVSSHQAGDEVPIVANPASTPSSSADPGTTSTRAPYWSNREPTRGPSRPITSPPGMRSSPVVSGVMPETLWRNSGRVIITPISAMKARHISASAIAKVR
jgi:hypothetical protein